MGNYNSGGRGGGRSDSRGFGGRDSGRGRDRDSGRFSRGGGRDRDRPREMFDVICDKCKKECQVPFKPSGDKPVLCSDCFKKEGGGSRGGGGMSSEQFEELNTKLDKVLKILGPDRNDDESEDSE